MFLYYYQFYVFDYPVTELRKNLHFQNWTEGRKMSAVYKDDQEDWLTVCLKYLLFVFNFLFWVSESSSKCTTSF